MNLAGFQPAAGRGQDGRARWWLGRGWGRRRPPFASLRSA